MVEIGERAGSGMDTIFEGWSWAGYKEPSYDVVYGPDRTTLTLPLVSADSTCSNRQQSAAIGRNSLKGPETDSMATPPLSANELMVLRLVESEGTITTRVASRATELNRQAASALLKRLTERGLLVWCGKSRNDPRQRYIAPTDKQACQQALQ